MSTDYIDYLSDIQLHHELIQHGFPNTPVTETTRQILIKKLKSCLKTEKTKPTNNRSSKRLSTAANNISSSHFQNESNDEKYTSSPSSASLSSSYLLRSSEVTKPQIIKPRAKLHSTENNNAAVTTNILNNRPYYENIEPPIIAPFSSSHHHSSPRMFAPPPILASESDSENDAYNYKYRKMCAMNYPVDSSKYDHPSNGGCGGGMTNIENTSDGGVVSRLLSLRGSTLQQKKPTNKISYINDNKYLKSARGNHRSLRSLYAKLVNHIKSKQDLSQHIIPYILIGTLVTFLMVITFLYLSRRYGQSLFDKNTTIFKICEDVQSLSTRQIGSDYSSDTDITCIEGNILQDALNINLQLLQLLKERTRTHYCVNKNHSPFVNLRDIFQRLRQNDKHVSIEKFSHAIIYLITQNPKWNIDIINGQGESVRDHEITNISLESLSFTLLKPELPYKCVIYNKAQRFFFIIGFLGISIVLLGILYFGFKYYKGRKRDRLNAAEQFAKDIVNEVIFQSSQAENGQSTDIVIDHLRDKLIPPNKRRQFLWSWNEALRKLEENDNRVMFGIALRNGKEMRTLSWNEMNSNELDFTNKKKWQSPAFDNANKIANPPTPCLKIRHMFDTSEVNHPALRQLIVDAIFEKVGSRCKICDIQLDKESCIVYLRCATEMDAGIVHNEINGWWFDKRLISIKFLRLERYLSRFPKSSNQPMRFISPNHSNVHQRS